MRRRRLAPLVAFSVLVGLALGVGIDIVRVGGMDAWLARNDPVPEATRPPYDARGRLVQVDGRDVYLDCRGSGSPTVVLEAGFGSGASSWGPVFDGIAATTRVCAWDRPGIARSTARPAHSAGEGAADLQATLDAAGEHGPYVVVAHSFGGVYARLFAEQARADQPVVALVMLDTYEPDLGMADDLALPDEVRAMIQRALDDTASMLARGESLDWGSTMQELDEAGPVSIPAVTLWTDPRGRYFGPDESRVTMLVDAWYRNIALRYPVGTVEVVPNAGHFIHLDQPALVLDRVRELVLRNRTP